MTTKRFITKTSVKIFIYAIFATIVLNLLNGPIITNELALLQMENSNVLYMLMDSYNKVKPLISIIYGVVTAGFVFTTIRDIYEFIKTKKHKGEN